MSIDPFLRDNLKFVLKGKKIIVGVCGSIAAFKTCDLIRFLRDCEAEVQVVVTQNALHFVTPLTLETLSGSPVSNSLWNDTAPGTHHIKAARSAHAVVVAPCTANFITKCALGFADDLLSTELLAFQGPILLAPAMNPAMANHPAIKQHIETLKNRGVQIIGPVSGLTACGEDGFGRMSEPDDIVLQLATLFHMPAKNKTALITLGPTQSFLDPIRYLTNKSSGLMGASLCWALSQQGYQIKVLCGPHKAALPPTIELIVTTSASQMAEAAFSLWPGCDLFIGVAAVLDWEIQNASLKKIKKTSTTPRLKLTSSPDILHTIGQRKSSHQFVLGFAAETHNPLKNGWKKLITKQCDALFINQVGNPHIGFESNENSGWWLSKNKCFWFDKRPKTKLARDLVAMLEKNQVFDIKAVSMETFKHATIN